MSEIETEIRDRFKQKLEAMKEVDDKILQQLLEAVERESKVKPKDLAKFISDATREKTI